MFLSAYNSKISVYNISVLNANKYRYIFFALLSPIFDCNYRDPLMSAADNNVERDAVDILQQDLFDNGGFDVSLLYFSTDRLIIWLTFLY